MRRFKASNSYLESQVRKNFFKAVLCAFIFTAIFAFLIFWLLSFGFSIFVEVGLLFLFVPLVAFYYYLREYHIYNGGLVGERAVSNYLMRNLDDDYYLINDLYLREGRGDIDHVVLGPTGVFVLETKNWSGTIVCNGDEWQRPSKRNFSSSPSRQVKHNVAKIRRIIDSSPNLKKLDVWVEGIVVLTNAHAKIHLSSPTVPVLKIQVLPDYIRKHGSFRKYSCEQLEAIGAEIIRLKA